MIRCPSLVAAMCLACGIASVALAQEKAAAPKTGAPAAKADARSGDPYYLATCPISGDAIGQMGDGVVKTYEGREVRFCCKDCVGEFEKDKSAAWSKVDAAMVKDQLPHYPLDTSVVSGKKLGDKPVDLVWNNRLVRVVDAAEKAEFQKEPAKYVKALDKAVIEKQSKSYALTKCPVMGDPLEKGEAKNVVIANRLIEVCCGKCPAKIMKNPSKYLSMVDTGGASAAPAPTGKK